MVGWDPIVYLDLHSLSHVVELDPILARFGDLRHPIFLWKYLLPDRLIIIDVPQITNLNNLKLRANPNPRRTHIAPHNNIRHLNIANLEWPFVFHLLFLALLLVLGRLLSFLGFLFLSSFHLLLGLLT